MMDTDRKWVVVRIDGKIAAISTDYRQLAVISTLLARSGGGADLYGEITATRVGMEDIWQLRKNVRWDDLLLFGTEFQKKVWRKLWELTHCEDTADTGTDSPHLISYSDFAGLCQNRAGVRAVAHAIGLNHISVIIPCHLVIPKESIDKIAEIHKKAEATIFKGDDLCISSILNDSSIDFGEYALGKDLKRTLISMELTERQ
ncbi:MAG: MGMT family protein [Bacteroidales bacterium]|nr:MGMT family protein [Bacteroidales bacterium]